MRGRGSRVKRARRTLGAVTLTLALALALTLTLTLTPTPGVREVAQERGRVCLVFDRAERLQPQEKLLSTLLTLPTLVSLGRAGGRSYVLPIFVAEALWAG